MRVSIPERTVDAWVSIAIVRRFRGALVWAPTTRGRDNWDLGVPVPSAARGPAGKLIVLENKGAVPLKGRGHHRITIDQRQLDRYCRTPALADRTFYVLPHPPWSGEPPHAVVPSQASHGDSAGEWLWVVPAPRLRAWLLGRGRKSVRTSQFSSLGAISLDDFLDEIDECKWESTWLDHVLDGPQEQIELSESKGKSDATLSPVAAFLPRDSLRAGEGDLR